MELEEDASAAVPEEVRRMSAVLASAAQPLPKQSVSVTQSLLDNGSASVFVVHGTSQEDGVPLGKLSSAAPVWIPADSMEAFQDLCSCPGLTIKYP